MNTKTTSDLSVSILSSRQKITLRLNGYSMYPYIKPGDIGTISKCTISSLNIGEVIVFKQGNFWIAHRLLEKQAVNGKYILIAKGDTSIKNDPPFSEEFFLGRLTGLSRSGKSISLETKKRNYLGFIIAKTTKVNSPFFILFKKIAKMRSSK